MRTAIKCATAFLLMSCSSFATTIAWDHEDTPNTAYHVKWGTATKSYKWTVDTPAKTLTFKFPKGKYYFVITAFDTVSGAESIPSNELIVTQ